jgi:hypothetical protein
MQKRGLEKLDRLAWLLDSSIRIPGTRWRIGLDGILGLIPGIGDALAALLSSVVIVQAVNMGMPKFVVARMMMNVLLELFVGMIPVVGDIFDFMFKANERNVALMRTYLDDPRTTYKRSRTEVVLITCFVVLLTGLIIWAVVSLLGWLVSSTGNI